MLIFVRGIGDFIERGKNPNVEVMYYFNKECFVMEI